jgi:phosphohistidine phosphatase SixA
MAKTFEFRRHSIKDGPTRAMVGPKGYALARAVGAAQLRGRGFNAFFVSSFFRTHQTFAAFAEGAADFVLKHAPSMPPIYLEREDVWEMWRACADAEKRGIDLVHAAVQHDAALVKAFCTDVAALFLAWAATLDDGTNALVLGHSPHLEFLYCGLANETAGAHFGGIHGLKECQGFRVSLDGDRRALDRFAPDLDPSVIRGVLFPETK